MEVESKQPRLSGATDAAELRIVMIGKTGTGKSATGNSILGNREFKTCLSGSSITTACQLGIKTRFNRKISVVDTPGLYDTGMTTEQVTTEIVKCITMTAPGPHAILLTVNVGRFTDEEHDTVKHFVNHFGEGMYNYLLVVFTRADELVKNNQNITDYVRGCPQSLKEILELCHNRYIPYDNTLSDSRLELQVKDLIGKVDEMVNRNNGNWYTNEMYEEAKKLMQRREEAVKQKLKEEEQRKVKHLQDEFDKQITLVEKKQAEQLLVQANKANEDRVAQLQKQMESERRLAQQMVDMKKEHDKALHAALSRPVTVTTGGGSRCSLM
ncbi:unnamed protein product [Mytilus coruscus]|uniref:AIG1-type G domain-containing protein n=1 Tax=Mytilus coruscus TaxID=42192 RepID=A0A6J8AC45_MYTCO|nr:unnamed protein product [Mytilus coruscus]